MIAFKAIRPKNYNYVAPFKKTIESAMETSAKEIKAEYKKTIRGWKRKPIFNHRVYWSGNGFVLAVYPDGRNAKQYNWVDYGTRPHKIYPKNAPLLVFYRNFKPRTRKAWIGSGTQKYSPPKVIAESVNNPGIESRDFSETIANNYQNKFKKNIELAMAKAASELEE